MRERDLARPRRGAAADQALRARSCGAARGTAAGDEPRRCASPATLWTCVISSASSKLGGGRMPGRRRASIVLPAPGGPTISRLWPPAAAISSARLASLLAAHVGEVGPAGALAAARARRLRRLAASSGRAAGRRAAPSVGIAHHLDPLDQRRLGARSPPARAGAGSPRARAPSAAASAPRTGRSSPAQRELAAQRAAVERPRRHLPARREHAHGDRQVEARARLAHVRGREVDGEPLLRELEPGVQQRGADALARLADRPVRQPDEREGRKPAAARRPRR